MGFLSKLWVIIRGFFIQSGDNLVSSGPDAIRSTYASAIKDAGDRYREMVSAVSLLARERERSELRLKDLEKERIAINRQLNGTLNSAELEPNNPEHREAGARYLERLKEVEAQQQDLEQTLQAQSQKVEDYKIRVRSFSEEIDRLKREQGEMVAEFVSNQQIISLENRLKGLGETSVDESLVAIREKVSTMRAKAKIATEMGRSSVSSQDRVYEERGAAKEAQTKFDELLKARKQTVETPEKLARNLG